MIIDCANDLLSNNISIQVTICQGILKYKTPYTSIPLTFQFKICFIQAIILLKCSCSYLIKSKNFIIIIKQTVYYFQFLDSTITIVIIHDVIFATLRKTIVARTFTIMTAIVAMSSSVLPLVSFNYNIWYHYTSLTKSVAISYQQVNV